MTVEFEALPTMLGEIDHRPPAGHLEGVAAVGDRAQARWRAHRRVSASGGGAECRRRDCREYECSEGGAGRHGTVATGRSRISVCEHGESPPETTALARVTGRLLVSPVHQPPTLRPFSISVKEHRCPRSGCLSRLAGLPAILRRNHP